MNRVTRKNVEEQGVILVFCSVLFLLFLWQMSEHIDSHKGVNFLREVFAVFVLPISAYFSANTVVCLASRVAPELGWWLRGLLRWTFYWMVHVLIASVAAGFAMTTLLGFMHRSALGTVVLIVPSLLLIRQVFQDRAAARRRYGSTARAERAAYPRSPSRF